jgi:hypothetical protein
MAEPVFMNPDMYSMAHKCTRISLSLLGNGTIKTIFPSLLERGLVKTLQRQRIGSNITIAGRVVL